MSLLLGELSVLRAGSVFSICSGLMQRAWWFGCSAVWGLLCAWLQAALQWPSLGSTGPWTVQFSAFRYHPHILHLPCHHLWPRLLISIVISQIFFIVRNYKTNWVKPDAFWISMAKLDVLLQKRVSESSQNADIFYMWPSVCFHTMSYDNRVCSGLSQTGLI